MEYHEFRAMNSNIVLAAEGDSGRLEEGFTLAQKFVETSESRFTRFSEESELAVLNRSAGRWVAVSSDLYELVREAYDYRERTGGLFDPSILGALEGAGYGMSMDEIRAQGERGIPVSTATTSVELGAPEFDPAVRAMRLPGDLRIDLGGIAKGWIAERAAHLLAEFATACAVNAGGDLFAVGTPAGETAWEIGLEDPRDENETITTLRVSPGAVATSSITKRRWHLGGKPMHHLIDPRTGLPANTDWLSVTAIAPRAAAAEVYAKSLLIAGSREAAALAARGGDIPFIAVDAEGKLWGSTNAGEFLNVGIKFA